MTSKTISALAATATPLAGTELIPVWTGATKRVTVSDLTAGRFVDVKGMRVIDTLGLINVFGTTASGFRGINYRYTVADANVYGDFNSVNTTRYGISILPGGTTNAYVTGCDFTNMASGDYEDTGGSTANNRFLNQYQGGSASVADTATATLFTFPSQLQGNYLFFAGQAGNANGVISAMAYVRVGSASAQVSSIVASFATLSASGLAVQVTNSAGGPVTFDYSWIKL